MNNTLTLQEAIRREIAFFLIHSQPFSHSLVIDKVRDSVNRENYYLDDISCKEKVDGEGKVFTNVPKNHETRNMVWEESRVLGLDENEKEEGMYSLWVSPYVAKAEYTENISLVARLKKAAEAIEEVQEIFRKLEGLA